MRQRRIVATIQRVGYGLRDFPDGRPGLWFGVSWGNGYGALMAYTADEAEAFIKEHDIYSLFELNGRACEITCDNNKVTFLGLVEQPVAMEG